MTLSHRAVMITSSVYFNIYKICQDCGVLIVKQIANIMVHD
jgi:hypothetical protein